MFSYIPDEIELVDYIEDGEHARHFHFRLLNFAKIQSKNHPHRWQHITPGQFFMLNVPSAGEAAFTFTESLNKDGEFRASIRKMGRVTSALFALPKGNILGARGPFGRGWPMTKITNSNTLIVAGGCGLAPLAILIEQLSGEPLNLEPLNLELQGDGQRSNKSQSKDIARQQELVLVYGSHNKANQMFSVERARWQKRFKIFNTLDEYESTPLGNEPVAPASDGSPITIKGTPLDILPSALNSFTTPATTALLCGPEVMMNNVATFLVAQGMASDSIYLALERRMHCGVGLCGHCYLSNQYVCKNGPVFSWQELSTLAPS